ncbi:MAG TPA: DUF4349 domain-containing protein [Candidatus Bilamarchaeaceae archaeon]|nr:DUF4349 domain-containing protein [Candidatus Bilamarchaeaceae archaeon]
MQRMVILIGLMALLFAAGCTEILGTGAPDYEDSSYVPGGGAYPAPDTASGMLPPGIAGESAYETEYLNSDIGAFAEEAPLLTKEAGITIEVERGELEDKLREAQDILAARGAETVSIFYDEYSGIKTHQITFKILPAEFDATLEALKQLGEVKGTNIEIEDVTREYTDLNIRLDNKQRELERLYELYDRSETVEELLDVEREITRVTTDIEQLESQQEDLQGRIARSTITLELYETVAATEAFEADVAVKVDNVENRLQELKDRVSDQGGEITSLQFSENSMEQRYVALVRLDAPHLEGFLEEVRTLGEIKGMDINIDEENRPEKSLVYVRLFEEKSAVQTDLFVPLETLLSTFFGALSTAIILLSALLGFLIPLGILVWIIYVIYQRVKKKSR